jgi:hypothetical protein
MKATSSIRPLTQKLTTAYVTSGIIILLLVAASAAGLRHPSEIYPTVALRKTSLPNDAVNLIVGLPTLLIPIWLARRGNANERHRLLGLVFWPGALFFVTYNATAYTFNLPFNRGWLLALGQLILSIYTIAYLIAIIDAQAVQAAIGASVPARTVGGVLAVLGAAYILRAIGIVVPPLIDPEVIVAETELGTLLADVIIAPAWIIGGLMLWQRKSLGAVIGVGLLYQAAALFLGLIVFLMLQPLFTGGPFLLVDTLVVTAMGLIVFIPFGLSVRGVVKKTTEQV